ncbi:SDR family NAD(P)-dependent oxidoreductase [Humibacter sp. RRB41]|uniref:SDR family NAD(P)-dependent oxidoreductase n=1 Tax=Humibacter sp. RRB41 TaxID=2919946 RepID=UPI001FAA9A0F|nr:SDR family oxidoreductase [Humibacter sp. RRB41]
MTDRTSAFATYPSLEGQHAFVSGGASGLGREFVSQLAGQGSRVSFVDLDEASGRSLVAEIVERGDPEPVFSVVDVRNVPALVAAIDDAADRFGPVTVLVNNAANDSRHAVAEVDVELWDERMAVNIRHHFFAAQAVAPGMRKAGHGSIINLGSISAHIDLTDLPIYIAAKAGVEGLTRTLARELGGDGIRVNCVIPGWIMTQRQLTMWVGDAEREHIYRMQALPELLYPADVARMVLWLAAEDSRLCTGQTWVVDGGWE